MHSLQAQGQSDSEECIIIITIFTIIHLAPASDNEASIQSEEQLWVWMTYLLKAPKQQLHY